MWGRVGEVGGEGMPGSRWWRKLKGFPVTAAVWSLRGYQRWVSPCLGPQCRFHPTCSQYAIEALRKYGLVRGSWKAVCRVARCHPWHPGGDDPP
jgi:uncharacterized protein